MKYRSYAGERESQRDGEEESCLVEVERAGESRRERARELLLSLFSAEPAGSGVHGNVLSLLKATTCMHPVLN